MRINDVWWAFFRSILITFGVSAILGLGAGLLLPHKIFSGIVVFIMAVVVQFAGGSIASSIAERRNKDAEFLAAQVLREASERKLPYDLNCAYCNTTNRVGISFNTENVFVCEQCKQPNKIYIQFTTVRMTEPLITKTVDVNYLDVDNEPGTRQTTINEPIVLNEK